mmetsp:Transcript_98684/g.247267  ORF Transcript_98684/g.247267 Transcript_98684/m.247267 type:complete len:257 (-) Transcript_98684:103-873(-)
MISPAQGDAEEVAVPPPMGPTAAASCLKARPAEGPGEAPGDSVPGTWPLLAGRLAVPPPTGDTARGLATRPELLPGAGTCMRMPRKALCGEFKPVCWFLLIAISDRARVEQPLHPAAGMLSPRMMRGAPVVGLRGGVAGALPFPSRFAHSCALRNSRRSSGISCSFSWAHRSKSYLNSAFFNSASASFNFNLASRNSSRGDLAAVASSFVSFAIASLSGGSACRGGTSLAGEALSGEVCGDGPVCPASASDSFAKR